MATKHIHIHLPARQLGKTKDASFPSSVSFKGEKYSKTTNSMFQVAKSSYDAQKFSVGEKVSTKMGGLGTLRGYFNGIEPPRTKEKDEEPLAVVKDPNGRQWLVPPDKLVRGWIKDAKDAGSTSSLEALEDELDKLQDDIEDLEDKGRSASQAQINRRKALQLQIKELKKKE